MNFENSTGKRVVDLLNAILEFERL